MRGFSWILQHRLAVMPRPGRGWAASGPSALVRDLAFLARQRIELLVSLTVDPLVPEVVRAFGIEPLHIPVADFAAPTLDQLGQFLDRAVPCVDSGRAVGVHCTAGRGRAGTFAAGFLVAWQGGRLFDGAAGAIAEIRRLRPGSIETAVQERAVCDLAEALMARPGR